MTCQFNYSSIKNSINLLSNFISLPKGKALTVLAFTGVSLFVVKRIFSSSQVNVRLSSSSGDEKNGNEQTSFSKLFSTLGHFGYNKYSKHHDGAINVIKKYFDKIVNPNANNRWDWIYVSQKDEIFKSIDFTKQLASCFGNCCALAKEIIRSGRVLSAPELQAIEKGDKFPKRAMGFQWTQNVCREICERVDKAYNTPAFERPSQLTDEERKVLGKMAQYFCYQRHIDCLQTYGLSLQEVSKLSMDELKVLWAFISNDVPFEWARKEIFEKPDLKTGKELIQWGALNGVPKSYILPTKEGILQPGGELLDVYPHLIYPKGAQVESKKHFYLSKQPLQASDLVKECPEIDEPNFSGFFIIAGSEIFGGRAGHAFLLEIDNHTNTYVLYDNNEGFYSGDNLEDCLEKLNARWTVYSYKTRTFYPYFFKTHTKRPDHVYV